MATTVNRNVNIYIQSGEAEKAYDRLIKKEQQLKDELAKATDPKQVQRLTNEINKLQEPIDRAAKKVSGELSPSVREATAAVKSLEKELQNMAKEDPNFKAKVAQFKQANAELVAAKNNAKGISNEVNNGNFLTRTASKINSFSESTFGIGIGEASGALAIGAFFKTAYEEATQAEQAAARFQATLDNLGKSELFDRLTQKADEFAQKFTFLDNDEVVEVFNKLITYGKLTESEIEKVTPVIIDFASKQRISLEESTDVIIKALEGNGKALKTYGINIKDAGTTTGRLNIILDELGTKVQGASDAFGATTEGRVKSMKQRFLDLAESIGGKLLPAINLIAQGIELVIIGAGDLVDKVGTAIQFIFNNAEYEAEKLANKQLELLKDAQDFGANVAKSFTSKATPELKKQLDIEENALKIAQNRLNKVKELTEEQRIQQGEDLEYSEKRVDEQTAIVNALKQELSERDEIAKRNKKELDDLNKKEREAAAKRQAEEIKKLIDELNKLQKQTNAKELSAFQQKLAEINIKFDELVKKAQELNRDDLVKKANQIRQQQIEDAFGELLKKGVRIPVRLDDTNVVAVAEDIDKKVLAIGEKGIQLLSATSIANAAKVGELQNIIAKSYGRDRLNNELALLEERKKQEVETAKKLGLSTSDIEKKYAKERADTIINYFTTRLSGITEVLNQVTDIFNNFNNLINANQNAQLEADRAVNDSRKANYQKQLDAKLISQKEYDTKISKLDAEQQKREQKVKRDQFKRDQIASIAQATINGAEAITKANAVYPPPFNIPIIALLATITAAQIALIASQKAPQFAKGGRLDGPTHSQGGMPILNPTTGRKVAEVEGGEVVLSRNTVRNNAALVDQLLYSSMYKNGAPVVPKWRNSSPSYLNIPVLSESMHQVRMFEKGGVLTGGNSNDNASAANAVVIASLQGSIEALNAQLSSGIYAYMYISQSEKQQQRFDAIRLDALVK